MNLSRQDRHVLERLRQRFLQALPQRTPYWTNKRELELYHATFAQRIGWKWRAVLDELRQYCWMLPAGVVVDLGCGTAIAAETVLQCFGSEGISELVLVDHSTIAVEYARERLSEQFRKLRIRAVTEWDIPPGSTVLISHMLTELDDAALNRLMARLMDTRAVLIVEPGTRRAAARVVAVREQLRNNFGIVAPCPHRHECGMLHPRNWQHWCHFHLEPPADAFTQRDWARFAELFKVDVGDMPVSFVVLDARWQQSPAGHVRLVGAPDVSADDIAAVVCRSDGVREQLVRKRDDPTLYRRLRKRPPRWLA